MRRAFLLLPLLLVACKGGRDRDVVGRWTLPSGVAYEIDTAKTFKVATGRIAASGTWSLDGDKVSLTQTVVNGKPIADLKASLQAQRAKMPANLQGMIDRMGAPETYVLSADGKSLTKQEGGRAVTLTKG